MVKENTELCLHFACWIPLVHCCFWGWRKNTQNGLHIACCFPIALPIACWIPIASTLLAEFQFSPHCLLIFYLGILALTRHLHFSLTHFKQTRICKKKDKLSFFIPDPQPYLQTMIQIEGDHSKLPPHHLLNSTHAQLLWQHSGFLEVVSAAETCHPPQLTKARMFEKETNSKCCLKCRSVYNDTIEIQHPKTTLN